MGEAQLSDWSGDLVRLVSRERGSGKLLFAAAPIAGDSDDRGGADGWRDDLSRECERDKGAAAISAGEAEVAATVGHCAKFSEPVDIVKTLRKPTFNHVESVWKEADTGCVN